MSIMNGEEKKEVKVYVKGKLVPVKELEKEYPEISLASSSGNVRIMQILIGAEKPLSKEDIANKAGLSAGFTRTLLKKLTKNGYTLEFQLGGRVLYYLLTEKGLRLSKEIVSQQQR